MATCSAGWNSPVFRAESGNLSKVVVWSPLSTENQRNLRLSHPTRRPTRKNGLFGLDRFERFLHQRRSGDVSGDKLGGLTDRLGGLPDSEQVLGGLSDRGKPCGERVPGTGAADKEKTNGDN